MTNPLARRTHPLLALAALLASPVTGSAQGDTTIVREQLAEGIHLFRVPAFVEQWTSTNTVVIVNETDVTVFDSNTRATTARRIIAEIRRLTDKPVRMLVNSHWHQDHWSGNDEYVKAWPGVQIVATTQTRDYMKRMMAPFFAHGARQSLESRRASGQDTTQAARFLADIERTPRVLPTIAFRDTLVLWSGAREFRLISVTGDATGSTVLYLPRERILVMGDVLVARSDGRGPPPWTTNSYAITAELFGAIIAQTHAALERGLTTVEAVQAVVDVDAIGRKYLDPGTPLPESFRPWVGTVVRKTVQEAFDGVVR